MDKSKANVLGKVLICVQIIWFAIQVITRLVAGYPLTLIELHTVVHVLCALMMYILWWEVRFANSSESCHVLLTFSIKKPQDITEALSRSTSQHLDILASLYVLQKFKDERKCEAEMLRYYGTQDVMCQTREFQTAYEEEDDNSYQIVVISNKSLIKRNQFWPKDPRPKNTVCELVEGQALHSLIGPTSHGNPRYLSVKDVRRWNCLAKYLRRPDIQEAANKLVLKRKSLTVTDENISSPRHDRDHEKNEIGITVSELLQPINHQIVNSLIFRQRNFIIIFNRLQLEDGDALTGWPFQSSLFLVFIIFPIAYGGIHLAVWNYQFASNIESLLWKVACIDIMTAFIASSAFKQTLWLHLYHNLKLLGCLKFLKVILCFTPTFLSIKTLPPHRILRQLASCTDRSLCRFTLGSEYTASMNL